MFDQGSEGICMLFARLFNKFNTLLSAESYLSQSLWKYSGWLKLILSFPKLIPSFPSAKIKKCSFLINMTLHK